MPRLTIELTQRQIEFLQEQARETNLPGPEYAAARVISSVERLREQTLLPELLRQGLDSGPAIDATDPAWWRDEKAKFVAAQVLRLLHGSRERDWIVRRELGL